ncbi:SDR family NAD(P)-dependent oxidoreductase [Desertibaculum subflavum]|uniref:SDR family NAD(P)-dependent oxidoreductase n=1 Tax=Desertibaculum subflavum TaxID=2268458 RepID=UPI000E669C95
MATAPARVAWVTGASSGIGRAVALQLAREGWRVAASARGADALAGLAAEAPRGTVAAYPLDVTDGPALHAVVAEIERALGPIDRAVLNAGTHKPVTADRFSAAPFKALLQTNVIGTVHGLEALIPPMQGRGRGQIAVVASVAGWRGLPTAAAYGASKAALINMAEALRPELAALGIDLRLVNPGFVETPLTAKNRFPMPFLISAEAAADRICRGLDGSGFEISFPRRFTWVLKCLRILPYRLYFPIIRRRTGLGPAGSTRRSGLTRPSSSA